MIQNFKGIPDDTTKISYASFCEQRSINGDWREEFHSHAFTDRNRLNNRTEKAWNSAWIEFLKSLDQEKLPL